MSADSTLRRSIGALALLTALLLSGCATVKPRDNSALRASRPASLLVLPPLNHSPDIKASYSVLAQVTQPLAESGYYVIPVAVMVETFRQNGLDTAADIHAVAPSKLREIFGADAALAIDITRYGTSYKVISSDTTVTASAKLVDLRSGALLWEGSASASSAENQNNNQGGLVGLLVAALVEQVIGSSTNQAHGIAGIMTQRLLTAGQPNGLLYGPRSPRFGQD